MKEELEHTLVETFPLCFADYVYNPKPEGYASPFKCFGIQHGDGWYQAVYNMCSKLEPLIQKWIEENPGEEHPRFLQLKEKFGIGRFYLSRPTEEMTAIIYATEKETGSICEECGAPGRYAFSSHKRFYTACETHKESEDLWHDEYVLSTRRINIAKANEVLKKKRESHGTD